MAWLYASSFSNGNVRPTIHPTRSMLEAMASRCDNSSCLYLASPVVISNSVAAPTRESSSGGRAAS
jgi:hypothetical protein